MLSKENFDKLDTDTLYLVHCDNKLVREQTNPYHCRNWTFQCRKYDEGQLAYMYDTYFGEKRIQVTDENIDIFHFVFKFSKVRQISDIEADDYDDIHTYRVATDSGGWSCGQLYWVDKSAMKSRSKIIARLNKDINDAQRQVRWAEDALSRFLNGDHYLCKDCEQSVDDSN